MLFRIIVLGVFGIDYAGLFSLGLLSGKAL
jgi:hypothetical protein